MLICPAVDLINGQCVRLAQGKFDQVSEYDENPSARLAGFVRDGAKEIHVVDLDGARAGYPVQHALIGRLSREAGVPIQAAGGIRARKHVADLLSLGLGRVVIGSMAVKDPVKTAEFLAEHGGQKIVLALDVEVTNGEPVVMTNGWQQSSGKSLWQVLDHYKELALQILVTDISRDGMLSGPNYDLMATIKEKYAHVTLQASGGVGSLDDIAALKSTGADAVIIGRALYEGAFTLAEAINAGA